MAFPPPSNNLPYPDASSMNTPIQQHTNGHINQFEIDDEDTSFQPIDAGHVGTGTMDNAAYPPAQPQPQQQQQQQQFESGGFGLIPSMFSSCFNFGSLQTYFDVDTQDVKDRVVGSVLHANAPDHFVNEVLRKPGKSADLYGPVWITMTSVFLFAVSLF